MVSGGSKRAFPHSERELWPRLLYPASNDLRQRVRAPEDLYGYLGRRCATARSSSSRLRTSPLWGKSMVFRFRSLFTLAPGIRMNLTGSGLSFSFGPRGASVGVGRRGVHANIGLPGTGLSYRKK